MRLERVRNSTDIPAPALAAEYGLVGSKVEISVHPCSLPTLDSP